MTHEQFITLETAKLAKQTGFDWETRKYYYFTNGEWKLRNSTSICEYILGNPNCISAPTQAVLQRWLREVKNLQICVQFDYIEIDPDNEVKRTLWSYDIEKITDETPIPRYETFEQKDSCEAALEAGLQKCLTLIIENKL